MDPQETKFYITFLITGLALLVIFFYLGWRLIKQKQLHENEKNRNYFKEVELLENERRRFSMDLHDELGPAVSLSEKMIAAVKSANKNDQELLDIAKEYLGNMNKRIREISQNIQAHNLIEKGLKIALTELLEQAKLSAHLSFSFSYKIQTQLHYQVKIHLFRMFQEMITNAVKHGKASYIRINIEESRNTISMVFKDNGVGFTRENIKGKGIGLTNLHHRASILQGQVEIESNVGKGTTIYITIPLNHRIWNQ